MKVGLPPDYQYGKRRLTFVYGSHYEIDINSYEICGQPIKTISFNRQGDSMTGHESLLSITCKVDHLGTEFTFVNGYVTEINMHREYAPTWSTGDGTELTVSPTYYTTDVTSGSATTTYDFQQPAYSTELRY